MLRASAFESCYSWKTCISAWSVPHNSTPSWLLNLLIKRYSGEPPVFQSIPQYISKAASRPGLWGHGYSLHIEIMANYANGKQLCRHGSVLCPPNRRAEGKYTSALPFLHTCLLLIPLFYSSVWRHMSPGGRGRTREVRRDSESDGCWAIGLLCVWCLFSL